MHPPPPRRLEPTDFRKILRGSKLGLGFVLDVIGSLDRMLEGEDAVQSIYS